MEEQPSHERSAARLFIAPAVIVASILVVLNLIVQLT